MSLISTNSSNNHSLSIKNSYPKENDITLQNDKIKSSPPIIHSINQENEYLVININNYLNKKPSRIGKLESDLEKRSGLNKYFKLKESEFLLVDEKKIFSEDEKKEIINELKKSGHKKEGGLIRVINETWYDKNAAIGNKFKLFIQKNKKDHQQIGTSVTDKYSDDFYKKANSAADDFFDKNKHLDKISEYIKKNNIIILPSYSNNTENNINYLTKKIAEVSEKYSKLFVSIINDEKLSPTEINRKLNISLEENFSNKKESLEKKIIRSKIIKSISDKKADEFLIKIVNVFEQNFTKSTIDILHKYYSIKVENYKSKPLFLFDKWISALGKILDNYSVNQKNTLSLFKEKNDELIDQVKKVQVENFKIMKDTLDNMNNKFVDNFIIHTIKVETLQNFKNLSFKERLHSFFNGVSRDVKVAEKLVLNIKEFKNRMDSVLEKTEILYGRMDLEKEIRNKKLYELRKKIINETKILEKTQNNMPEVKSTWNNLKNSFSVLQLGGMLTTNTALIGGTVAIAALGIITPISLIAVGVGTIGLIATLPFLLVKWHNASTKYNNLKVLDNQFKELKDAITP